MGKLQMPQVRLLSHHLFFCYYENIKKMLYKYNKFVLCQVKYVRIVVELIYKHILHSLVVSLLPVIGGTYNDVIGFYL